MSYVAFKPGDSIQADALNTMQDEIQKDIQKRIEAVKQDLRCPKRYFLDMETPGTSGRLQPAVLIHDLNCNPTIQVYELQDLPIASKEITREYKFCICAPAHFPDPEAMEFLTKSWDERHWGDQLDVVMKRLAKNDPEAKKFKQTYTLTAWISVLQELLFEPGPAQYHFDMEDIYLTKWIRAREGKTVEELDAQGEWPPRIVYRPRLVNNVIVTQGGETSDSKNWIPIGIFHLNLNEVEIAPEINKRTCLMVLLGS
jgi:hypothetical protein